MAHDTYMGEALRLAREAFDRGDWPVASVIVRDGRILDLFWTYDNTVSIYLNIHARESRDAGQTWAELLKMPPEDFLTMASRSAFSNSVPLMRLLRLVT